MIFDVAVASSKLRAGMARNSNFWRFLIFIVFNRIVCFYTRYGFDMYEFPLLTDFVRRFIKIVQLKMADPRWRL